MNTGNGLSLELGEYQTQIEARLKQFQDHHFAQQLWKKEKSLWDKKNGASEILTGWMDVVEKMLSVVPSIEKFCKTIHNSEFEHVVLLGMGGSSLAPMVFRDTFNLSGEKIKFTVLDSTEPEVIKRIENEINISTTLFIVSSKSGSTAEVMAFYNYFYSRVFSTKGENSGENFIAITDEGSPLVDLAARKKFRKTFINFPEIGGRYSALSYFGIVPAALMGINIKELLERTQSMIKECSHETPLEKNPGIVLGIAIAELASHNCDKLTYLLPPSLNTFGLWLEQLLAESTGKSGKGILPMKGQPLIEMETYGRDRVFFQLELSGKQDSHQSKRLEDFITMKFPVINILIKDELDLGREFFRWEIATATAGAILGVNPFDQPNVQESKSCTDKLLRKLEEEGRLPEMHPVLSENSINYYYASHKAESSGSLLEDIFNLTKQGDYIALQTYLPEEVEVENLIFDIRLSLQKKLRIAVTNEFGPRYLHSTGQYHKGGPNNGIFIQFLCNSSVDIQIPGQHYTFGLLKRAQAIGDMEALLQHGRRVLLVDLGVDYISGLNNFKQVIEKVQSGLYNERVIREQLNSPYALFCQNSTVKAFAKENK